MRTLLRTTILIISAILLTVAHVVFKIFTPFPFNQINFIFLVTILLIIFKDYSQVFILILIPTFFLELFSTYPFGINSAALILSISILGWFLKNIFTNHSFYIVFLISILSMLWYHLIFLLIAYIFHFFSPFSFNISTQNLREWLTEILFTSGTTTILYLLISVFNKRKVSHYIGIKDGFVSYE